MRHFHTSMITTAFPEKVWGVWSSAERWHEWDKGVESATINGVFQEGQTGLITLSGLPQAKYYLSGVKNGRSFTNHILLPWGAEIQKWHIIADKDKQKNTFEITHGVRIMGRLSFIFGLFISKKMKRELEDSMDAVRALAGDTGKRIVLGLDGQEKGEEKKPTIETAPGNADATAPAAQTKKETQPEAKPEIKDDPIIKV